MSTIKCPYFVSSVKISGPVTTLDRHCQNGHWHKLHARRSGVTEIATGGMLAMRQGPWLLALSTQGFDHLVAQWEQAILCQGSKIASVE